MTLLFSTAYLAPVSYYTCLFRCDPLLMDQCGMEPDTACIEQNEHYHKQTYRNRCTIAAANGPLDLCVPVIKKNGQPIRDVRIDYKDDWQHKHWNSIASAYSTTPYFEYYQDDILPMFRKKHGFLFDKNEAMCEVICSLLGISPAKGYSTDYIPETDGSLSDSFIDLRNAIHPKRELPLTTYTAKAYPQVFDGRYGFLPEMSILDLLFNMGPEALLILRDSTTS